MGAKEKTATIATMGPGEFLQNGSSVENSSNTTYEIFSLNNLEEFYDSDWEEEQLYEAPVDSESFIQHPNNELNIIVVSVLLILGLTGNLVALPVMLFRRTKFGNGQFAVLVLVLTTTDLLTLICGLVGALALELSDWSWAGSSLGCSSYYFLSSWLLGATNYLVSVLTSLLHVKRSTGWVARLAEVRSLLVVLLVATLLPALPELLIRSTVSLSEDINVCIISASPLAYAFYVAVKLLLLHLLPAAVVLLSLLRPQTKVAKRFSSLFLGEGAACECGAGGLEVSRPHQCPQHGLSQPERPDLVTSHSHTEREKKTKEMEVMLKQTKMVSVRLREDPHRRGYKRLLSLLFLCSTLVYLVLDLSYQVQSLSLSESEEGASLATALLPATYIKQIINPAILLYLELLLDISPIDLCDNDITNVN